MKLNPFIKADKSTYLPDKKLYYCIFSTGEEFDINVDPPDLEENFETCYVLADSIEETKKLIIKECELPTTKVVSFGFHRNMLANLTIRSGTFLHLNF